MVVLPYVAEYRPTEKTSTLLVDAGLRREYERLHINIDDAKGGLVEGSSSGSKIQKKKL